MMWHSVRCIRVLALTLGLAAASSLAPLYFAINRAADLAFTSAVMAQNVQGYSLEVNCRACEDLYVGGGTYLHRMLSQQESCGGGDPEEFQQPVLGGDEYLCGECSGKDVLHCGAGHDCCHRGWTSPEDNVGCWDHSSCLPGGDPDPDFSSVEIAHRIDRIFVQPRDRAIPGAIEMVATALAQVLADAGSASWVADAGSIKLYGCGNGSLPIMAWAVPSELRSALAQRTRLAITVRGD